jgi:putative membrane protein
MNDKKGKTHDGQLVLRDRLAGNRTSLANERTLLSYVRTALALFAAGLSFVHFFDTIIIVVAGWVLLPLGVYTLVKGFISFRNMSRVIREEEKEETLK